MKTTISLLVLFVLFAVLSNAIPLETRAPNIHVLSSSKFCAFLPPHPGDDVADTENYGVPYCTKTGLGSSKIFPIGFIKTAHYKETSNYVQVTGKIDRTKYSLKSSDQGGQYDYKDNGPTLCNGYKYFVNLLEPNVNLYCIRCCKHKSYCKTNHSTEGCKKAIPGNYS